MVPIAGSHDCAATIWDFCDHDIHWSEIPRILPGMKVSPLSVVWQDGKLQVGMDHSASGLNDSIWWEDAKVKYDDMQTFGQCLHDAHCKNPGCSLLTPKSDVVKAFLNLPAHPCWQIWQEVCVDDQSYIVLCLVFSNHASPCTWCAVSSLICWIAVHKLGVVDLHVYMDNFFGWDFANCMLQFRGVLWPSHQIQLLLLWEAIGCPFDDDKQLCCGWSKIVKSKVGILGSEFGKLSEFQNSRRKWLIYKVERCRM